MKYLIILLMLGMCGSVSGQGARYLALELGGSGGLASLNYEQSFFQKNIHRLHFRAGFSMAPVDRNNGTALVFPVMVHWLAGRGRHHLDTGAGQSFSITTKGSFFLRTPLCLGYRIEPPDKRFYVRFAYTPIVSYLLDFQWEHWAGIALGYRFGGKP